MAQPFLGEIRVFAFDFPPPGWAFCNGQSLNRGQYESLNSLLQESYGGDDNGFFLPDLRGRVAVGYGASGDWELGLGSRGGLAEVRLSSENVAPHTHTIQGRLGPRTQTSPANHALVPGDLYTFPGNANGNFVENAITGVTPSWQPHNNMQPYLRVNFCIALFGEYPQFGNS